MNIFSFNVDLGKLLAWNRAPRTVLVVEDCLEDSELIRHAAETAGLQVEHATTAEEARGILHANGRRFVLALIDVRLPAMDGWELRREIMQHWPALPIVIMSSSPDSFYDIPRGEKISILIKPPNFAAIFRDL